MPFATIPLLRRFEPLRKIRQRRWAGYAAAVGAVAAAAALRVTLGFHLPGAVFVTFYPAVVLASLMGGALAGALAVALSAVAANFLFLPPHYAFSIGPPDLVATALFVAVSAFLVWLVDVLTRLTELATDQAEEIRTILEAQPAGVVVVDADGIIRLVNTALERQLGYARGELVGRPVEILVPETLQFSHAGLRRDFMRNAAVRTMGLGRDLHAVRKDGSLVPVEIGLAPLQRGGLIGALATVVDISERKQLEYRAQMLTDEVRHRARNLLTIVQALARRSLHGEQRASFTSLLQTLARTQELLGADEPVSLANIVEGELTSFQDQVVVSGCELLLKPRAAQDFSLIVHELITNALKYGALSTAEGRVTITGQDCGDGSFTFSWSEEGGPDVAAPTKKGLGRSILEDLARSFALTVEASYGRGGFHYRLRADLDHIRHAEAVQSET
jgi:PAS domain S-box-containing protein